MGKQSNISSRLSFFCSKIHCHYRKTKKYKNKFISKFHLFRFKNDFGNVSENDELDLRKAVTFLKFKNSQENGKRSVKNT